MWSVNTIRICLVVLLGLSIQSVKAISGASYDSKSFSYSSQASHGAGTEFSPDGTKAYISSGGGAIYQYTCSTPSDASTCTYASKSCNVSSQTTSNHSVIFNTDGTKMYTNSNEAQYQYSLSSAYDMSTCSYDSVSITTTSQDTSTYESQWNPDGTIFYVLGVQFDKVYQYTCSSAYSLSSCSYASKSLSVGTQESYPWGLGVRSDGKKVYVVGQNRVVYRYDCTTGWDMSSCSYDSDSYTLGAGSGLATGLAFKSDGSKMYVPGWTDLTEYQFSTAETWPSTVPTSGLSFGGMI